MVVQGRGGDLPRAGQKVWRCWWALWLLCWVGCAEPGPPPMPEGAACVAPPPRGDELLAAGSGSNLPLMEALISLQPPGTERPRLATSIGTAGAIKALRRGDIDIGLASRGLKLAEQGPGLRQVPLASTPVVFATHPGVRSEALPVEALEALYLGRRATWPDGSPVVLLVREAGDSAEQAIAGSSPRLARALAQARQQERALVLTTDQEMERALANIPGAVGYTDLGLLRLRHGSPRLLRLVGEEPRRWEKQLSVLVRQPTPERVQRWLTYLTTQEARDALVAAGYRPAR